jgi:ribosomal protein L12E/L44/L45/RPP1/RPP2
MCDWSILRFGRGKAALSYDTTPSSWSPLEDEEEEDDEEEEEEEEEEDEDEDDEFSFSFASER